MAATNVHRPKCQVADLLEEQHLGQLRVAPDEASLVLEDCGHSSDSDSELESVLGAPDASESVEPGSTHGGMLGAT